MMNEFTVGSKAFFSCYPDFEPHDNDTLILVDEPEGFKIQQQIRLKGDCIFRWKRMTAREFVDYHRKVNVGIFLGKFLVPEFAKEIGLTIGHLSELRHLSEKLDERHLYEKIIFDSYLENGDFVLTVEQRDRAYGEYKKNK